MQCSNNLLEGVGMHINSKQLLERVPSVGLKMLDEQHLQIQSYAVKIRGLNQAQSKPEATL